MEVTKAYRYMLREWRLKTQQSQQALADLLDCDRRSIIRYENNEGDIPMPRLWKLCVIFGCTLNDLVKSA